jgi:hypothetical protein
MTASQSSQKSVSSKLVEEKFYWYAFQTNTCFELPVGLKVNTEKTKYVFISHDQNAGQNLNMKVASIPYENARVQVYGNDNGKSKSD